jgi:predicted  nucleic acid-binding Zn-ribbon protein
VAENYKTNLEEQEKHYKNTMKDFEREARGWRDKIDEKSEEVKKEKERSEQLQRKVDKLKDKKAQQDREIARLEKDIEEYRLRSHENRAFEDNESIKRQLNFMMQSIEKLQTGYARNGEAKEIDDLRRQIQRTQKEIKHIKGNPNQEDLNMHINKTSYTEPASPVPKQTLEAYSAKRKAQLDLTRSLDGALNWENLEQPKTQDAPVVTFPSNESYERNKDTITRLENTLSGLHIEKQRLENELNKLPEQSRTLSLKKRRNELEMQLAMMDQNITNIKSKLRRFNA